MAKSKAIRCKFCGSKPLVKSDSYETKVGCTCSPKDDDAPLFFRTISRSPMRNKLRIDTIKRWNNYNKQ